MRGGIWDCKPEYNHPCKIKCIATQQCDLLQGGTGWVDTKGNGLPVLLTSPRHSASAATYLRLNPKANTLGVFSGVSQQQ